MLAGESKMALKAAARSESEAAVPFGSDGQYFSTPTLSKQLKLAHHLIGYSDSLLVVSGERGSGKTRFLKETAELASDWRICTLEGREVVEIEALIRKLSEYFPMAGLGEPDSDEAQTVRELLRSASRPAGAVVLMIDDAHLLASATLELLVELACTEAKSVLRLVLAVSPAAVAGIQQLAQQRAAGQRVHRIEMPSLSEEETADFLHLLMSQVEWAGDSPFSDAVVHTVYQRSNGLPGRIREVATEVLQPQAESSSRLSGMTRGLVGWGAVAAVLLLGSWVLFRGGAEAPEKQFSQPALPPQTATQPEPVIPIVPDMPTVASGDKDEHEQEVKVSPVPIVQPPVVVADDEIKPPAEAVTTPVVVPPPMEVVAADPVASSVELETVAETTVETSAGKQSAPMGLETPVKKRSVVPEELAALHDLSWLARQPGSHYTIQIFGTYHLDSLRKFVVSRAADHESAWFETTHRERPWYVLVQGVYSDRNGARTAIANLPAALREAKPWVRSIASITATATSRGR